MQPGKISRLVTAASAAFLFGLFPGAFCSMVNSVEIIVFVILTAAAFLIVPKKYRLLLACLLFALGFGFLRGYSAAHQRNSYASILEKHAEIFAVSVSEPKPAAYGQEEIELRAGNSPQKILASSAAAEDPQFGKRWIISGTFHASTAKINGKYLLSKNIYAVIASPQMFLLGENKGQYFLKLCFLFKDKLYNSIFQKYPVDQAVLLKAVIFGDRSGMDSEEINEYLRTGAIHLIAVSGFKLTLLLICLRAGLRQFFGKKISLSASLAFSIWYCTVFAFDPPILRSGAMSTIFLASEFAGGGFNSLRILILSAAFMGMLNPLSATYDSSFMFSVLGVVGISLILPKTTELCKKVFAHWPMFLSDFFIAPLSAFLFTLPLSSYSYGGIPLLSPFSSLLLTPLLAPCIVLGYFSAMPKLGQPLAVINGWILNYFSFLPKKLSSINFLYPVLQIKGVFVYFIYLIIFATLGIIHLKSRPRSGKID